MPFGLPLDPSLLFQRTGRACYDEYGYPRGSIDPGGEAWYFYDDTCIAKNAEPLDSTDFACNYCHCSFPRPTLDCVDALALKGGLVQPTFIFTRLPWSSTVADSYRLPRDLPPPVRGGADLVGFRARSREAAGDLSLLSSELMRDERAVHRRRRRLAEAHHVQLDRHQQRDEGPSHRRDPVRHERRGAPAHHRPRRL